MYINEIAPKGKNYIRLPLEEMDRLKLSLDERGLIVLLVCLSRNFENYCIRLPKGDLAKAVGVSRATMIRKLKALEDKNIIYERENIGYPSDIMFKCADLWGV